MENLKKTMEIEENNGKIEESNGKIEENHGKIEEARNPKKESKTVKKNPKTILHPLRLQGIPTHTAHRSQLQNCRPAALTSVYRCRFSFWR